MLARIDRAAAFTADANFVITGCEPGGRARVLGVAPRASVRDIALGPGEAQALADHIVQMFRANDAQTTVVRSRAARADRLVVLASAAFAASRRTRLCDCRDIGIAWPKGFSELLRGAFDLTPAEAEVVRALAEGQNLTESQAPGSAASKRARATEGDHGQNRNPQPDGTGAPDTVYDGDGAFLGGGGRWAAGHLGGVLKRWNRARSIP